MTSLGAGLRRTTPDRLAATEFAREYRKPGARRITRTAALNAAKRAAAAMGLKGSKIALIDKLFAYTKVRDWTDENVVPIVWPSNRALAHALGVGVSTMKHHLNGLVEAGLVAYNDGPTYQRRGRRDEDGRIVEAAGIDLSPIAVRFAELTEMADMADFGAREWTRYSNRRTVLRKEIQALILSAREEGFDGPWDHAQARLDVIREARAGDLDELASWVAQLESIQEDLEAAYNKGLNDRNMHTAVSKFRPLLTTAEKPYSEISNQARPRANARDSNSQAASGSMAFETKPGEAERFEQDRKRPQAALGDDLQFISLPLVRNACPNVATYAPNAFESWSALRETGRELCGAAGINPQVWQEAISVLGPDMAIAALAVTIQKRDDGRVAKPGAYLRTLVQRGREGELHISRSLFGMAQAGYAAEGGLSPTAVEELVSFPARGSIHFSRWREVVREHAPKPTPDPDLVAERFRSWAKSRQIDLTSPNIERTFAGFCRKWTMN
ncbi:plasmid replication protein RepC [Neoaquamicrobium sediminum]|uniref:plasmid replication protein RepC n=2 Tax=Neoaquamicrobium sediminum TaxID=1849104 RepID=UPI003616BA89